MRPMKAHIPLPLQVVIDDVGWWSGRNGHEINEPSRTGMPRDHVPADYDAIAQLGKALGMRPLAAMVLCEWDRKDRLREVPTATWMGTAWRNPWKNAPIEQTREIIEANRAHMELALHAVGHEYWEQEKAIGPEWYDLTNRMRPHAEVVKHLDAFYHIFDDIGFSEHPVLFVPAHFCFAFGSGDGFLSLLRSRGIRHNSSPFEYMRREREPETQFFGVDEGMMTIDRGRDLLHYSALGRKPSGVVAGPVVGMHWPNILHEDPVRNAEVVERWVAFLAPYGARPDRMLARNSDEFLTQLAFHAGARIETDGETIAFDFSSVIASGIRHIGHSFTVKIEGAPDKPAKADGMSIDAFRKDTEDISIISLTMERGIRHGRLSFL